MDASKARRRFYGPDQLDNDSVFLDAILAAITSDMRILDAGAGAGDAFPYDLKNKVTEIVGVDLDPRVVDNPRLHRGIKSDVSHIPCDDDYFDLVFSRYVLEHVADPKGFLSEIHRVMKPGGLFMFLTPNKWHYVSLVSRLTPHSFHAWFNRLRGREEHDTFPTLYKLNSAGDLKHWMGAAGFEEEKLIMRECCPNYLTFSLPTFLLGVAYERTVNAADLLARLRVNIIGQYRKTA